VATDLREQIRERRLDRMRLGQAVCAFSNLTSDPEIRLALVPLSDAEAQNALQAAAHVDTMDNVAGLMLRDHVQRVEQLVFSIRDPQDLEKRLYRNSTELQEELTEGDIAHIYDDFMELTESSNPTVEGIDPEEFETLKKVWQEISWSDLSGRSWYAAKRFLGALIQDGLLQDNSPGSFSNTKLTMPNASEESTPIA
jgi:hypothetical protein